MAVIAEAGMHLDIPESTTNPIFMPQAGKRTIPLEDFSVVLALWKLNWKWCASLWSLISVG